MLEDFGKKIQHDQLQENYLELCAKKNMSISEKIATDVFIYPPTYSSVLSLSYLQSLLFVDVLAKWNEQKKDTNITHHTLQIDPLYLKSSDKNIEKQSSFMLETMHSLGVVHKQKPYNIEFVDFVSQTLFDLYKKNAVHYSYDVRYWSIEGQTVIGDSQLIKEPIQSRRLYIKFFIDMKKHTVTASIDDPIYLFGVTALGVNPYDKRYKKMVGKNVIVPIINKKVPIIADERVDMTKESGVILLYPAHNRQHLMIAKDHNVACDALAVDIHGNFTHLAGEFAGKNAYDFRENLVQYLQDISNLESIKQVDSFLYKDKFHSHHTLLPLATQQWFFDHVNQHLTDTLQVYLEGTESEEIFQDFFVSEPSCISKQLSDCLIFPVLTTPGHGVEFVHSQTFSSRVSLQKTDASNGMLTHVVLLAVLLGKLHDGFSLDNFVEYMHQADINYGYVYAAYYSYLKDFYAEDTVVLSELSKFADIMHKSVGDGSLFDDVAMLLEQAQGLAVNENGSYSFDRVSLGYAEGTSLATHTISTSFLSALDLLFALPVKKPEQCVIAIPRAMTYWAQYILSSELIASDRSTLFVFDKHADVLLDCKTLAKSQEKWGSDAVRCCILEGSFSGEGELVAGSAELYNRSVSKLWNASRYIYKESFSDSKNPPSLAMSYKNISDSLLELSDFDVWILLKLNHTIEEVDYYLQRKNVSKVLSLLTKFVWYDFSDSYLEVTKDNVSNKSKDVLIYSIGVILQLLHPFLPFVTTSLWKFFSFEGSVSSQTFMPIIEGLEKNYKFGLLMDLISKWNHLHANHRATHLYDDLHIHLQANRDFLEYARNYEQLICKMTDALDISFVSLEEGLDQSLYTDSLIDITIGVSYVTTRTPHQNLNNLQVSLEDKKQMLENIRTITLTLDHTSPSYQEYRSKIQQLKNDIDLLELDISQLKYSSK